MTTNFPFRVTFNTLFLLLLLKVYFFIATPLALSYLYLVSWVQDAALLILVYVLFVYSTQKYRLLHFAGQVCFFILFLPLFVLTFVYSFFLLDLYHFPMNIFSISADNFAFFLTYFTNAWVISLFLLILTLFFCVSYYYPQKLWFGRLIPKISLLLLLLFIPTTFKPFVNPILFSLHEEALLSLRSDANIVKLQAAKANKGKEGKFNFLNKSLDAIPQNVQFTYKRIVVLVMEGLKYDDFISESDKDPDSFLNRYKTHIKQYTNYHTLNIDSFTSLMAMLNSIFVPYQSHLSKDKYAFTDKCNNLVRFFNQNNYTTFFITSYGKQQATFVPDIPEWTTSYYLDSLETITQYACITTTKIENACEDNIVLQNLTDTVAKYPQIFALQEMVYGHMTEWLAMVGKTPTDYYNRYFNQFAENLNQRGLLDSTLIIIVSDHGPKENAYNIANYHIPFLAFATNIDTTANNAFVSHLDFKDILLQTATTLPITIQPQPIFTLGNSIELVYGTLRPNGKYALITNRRQYAQSNLSKQQIHQFNKDFQEYLNYYEYLRDACE